MARSRKALLVAGGAVMLLVAGGVASQRRTPGFAAVAPDMAAEDRAVLLARSTDGLHWTFQPKAVARGIDTPELAEVAGQRLLYGIQDPGQPLLVRDLDSGRVEELDLGEACHGDSERHCADPAALVLPDGSVRLYFVSVEGHEDPATQQTEIRSARSPDGWSFVVEEGARLVGTGIVDPDPVMLSDGRVRLYFSQVRGGFDADIVVASAIGDGLRFELEPGVRLRGASASRTWPQPDGGFRTWYHDTGSRLRTATSADGLQFTPQPDPLVGQDPLPGSRYVGVEAPTVLQEADGSYTMALGTVVQPPWPLDALLLWETRRDMAKRR